MKAKAALVNRTHPLIREAAEAVGVPTDLVLAVVREGDDIHVMYGEHAEHQCKLRYGADGVLRVSHRWEPGANE